MQRSSDSGVSVSDYGAKLAGVNGSLCKEFGCKKVSGVRGFWCKRLLV